MNNAARLSHFSPGLDPLSGVLFKELIWTKIFSNVSIMWDAIVGWQEHEPSPVQGSKSRRQRKNNVEMNAGPQR